MCLKFFLESMGQEMNKIPLINHQQKMKIDYFHKCKFVFVTSRTGLRFIYNRLRQNYWQNNGQLHCGWLQIDDIAKVTGC